LLLLLFPCNAWSLCGPAVFCPVTELRRLLLLLVWLMWQQLWWLLLQGWLCISSIISRHPCCCCCCCWHLAGLLTLVAKHSVTSWP
jgi:hypothetical protein